MRLTALLLLAQYACAQQFICGSVTTNSTAPKSAHCGAEGKARKIPVSSSTTSSFNVCRNSCLAQQGTCQNFSYNFNSGQCSIWKASNIGFSWQTSSDTYFWKAACFTVTGTFYPVNAVTNGNFASGTLDGWSLYPSASNVTVQSYPNSPSGYYMQLQSIYDSYDDNGYVSASQNVPLCASAPYILDYEFFQVPGGTIGSGGNYPGFGVGFATPSGNIFQYNSFTYVLSDSSARVETGSTNYTLNAGQAFHLTENFNVGTTGQWYLQVIMETYNANVAGTFMDPLSIATGALGAASLLLSVYNFIQATKETDRSVSNLQGQIGGTAKVLEVLSEVLKKQCLEKIASENQDLWLSVNGSVQSCHTTVVELQDKLDPVKAPRNNALRQAWRQMKLGMMQSELDSFLSALKTHSVNLQLSMQLVNVLITTSSQEVLTKHQASRFDKLEKMIIAVDSRWNLRSNASSTLVDASIRTVTLDENTVRLRRNADSLMSRASTVAALSVCEEFRDPLPPAYEPAFDYINDQETRDYNSHHEIISTTGSERGFELASSHRNQIQEWNAAVPQIDEMSEGGTSVIKSQTVVSTEEISLASEPDMTDNIIFHESSDDDDISYEVVRNLLKTAEEHFEHQQFKLAERYFRRALKEAERFGPQKSTALKLKDRQLRLAICCLHTGRFDECEKQFLSLAEESIHTSADAERTGEALHSLGCLHLRKRNLEAALIHSRQAHETRRKIKSIGKRHPDYFKSVRLYAIILWAQGDDIQADAYSKLLPEDQRLSDADFENSLANEFAPQNVSDNDRAIAETQRKIEDAPTPEIQTNFAQSRPIEQQMQSPETPSRSESGTISAVFTERKASSSGITSGTKQEEQLRPPLEKELSLRLPPSRSLEERLHEDLGRTKTPAKFQVPDLVGSGLSLHSNESEMLAAETRIREAGYYSRDKASKGLLWASQIGDHHALNCLLTRPKIDVNIKEKGLRGRGRTPLSYAVENGCLNICSVLIHSSADVNYQVNRGETLLLRAASKNLGGICQLLLQNGADVHCGGATMGPLSHSAKNGNLELCKVLLSYGANLELGAKSGVNPLQCAVKANKSRVCEFLANQGASLEPRLSLDVGSGYVRSVTPLMWTVYHNNSQEICRILLLNGADIDARDLYKETALMHAAILGNIVICRILLEHGADVKLRNIKMKTAAGMASNSEIKRLLLA